MRMVSLRTKRPKRKFFVPLRISHSESLRPQIDTGATSSCTSIEKFHRLQQQKAEGPLDVRLAPKVQKGITLRLLHLSSAKKSRRCYPHSLVVRFGEGVERAHRVSSASEQNNRSYEELLKEYADILDGLDRFHRPVKIETDPR